MKTTLFLAEALLWAGCAVPQIQAEHPVRTFYPDTFVGLVSTNLESYGTAKLNFKLHSAQGAVLHLSNCLEVENLAEERIKASELPQFRLLKLNCLALKRYFQSTLPNQTFLPPHLSSDLVHGFPAEAVPHVNKEDTARRHGKTLSEYEPRLEIQPQPDGSVRATITTEQWVYTLMARGDFDGDGIEDWLVRVDWGAADAMDQASDLFVLSRKSVSSPITIAWRP